MNVWEVEDMLAYLMLIIIVDVLVSEVVEAVVRLMPLVHGRPQVMDMDANLEAKSRFLVGPRSTS